MIVDGAERNAAEQIGRQIDFLNKELIRLQVILNQNNNVLFIYDNYACI